MAHVRVDMIIVDMFSREKYSAQTMQVDPSFSAV